MCLGVSVASFGPTAGAGPQPRRARFMLRIRVHVRCPGLVGQRSSPRRKPGLVAAGAVFHGAKPAAEFRALTQETRIASGEHVVSLKPSRIFTKGPVHGRPPPGD